MIVSRLYDLLTILHYATPDTCTHARKQEERAIAGRETLHTVTPTLRD